MPAGVTGGLPTREAEDVSSFAGRALLAAVARRASSLHGADLKREGRDNNGSFSSVASQFSEARIVSRENAAIAAAVAAVGSRPPDPDERESLDSLSPRRIPSVPFFRPQPTGNQLDRIIRVPAKPLETEQSGAANHGNTPRFHSPVRAPLPVSTTTVVATGSLQQRGAPLSPPSSPPSRHIETVPFGSSPPRAVGSPGGNEASRSLGAETFAPPVVTTSTPPVRGRRGGAAPARDRVGVGELLRPNDFPATSSSSAVTHSTGWPYYYDGDDATSSGGDGGRKQRRAVDGASAKGFVDDARSDPARQTRDAQKQAAAVAGSSSTALDSSAMSPEETAMVMGLREPSPAARRGAPLPEMDFSVTPLANAFAAAGGAAPPRKPGVRVTAKSIDRLAAPKKPRVSSAAVDIRKAADRGGSPEFAGPDGFGADTMVDPASRVFVDAIRHGAQPSGGGASPPEYHRDGFGLRSASFFAGSSPSESFRAPGPVPVPALASDTASKSPTTDFYFVHALALGQECKVAIDKKTLLMSVAHYMRLPCEGAWVYKGMTVHNHATAPSLGLRTGCDKASVLRFCCSAEAEETVARESLLALQVAMWGNCLAALLGVLEAPNRLPSHAFLDASGPFTALSSSTAVAKHANRGQPPRRVVGRAQSGAVSHPGLGSVRNANGDRWCVGNETKADLRSARNFGV